MSNRSASHYGADHKKQTKMINKKLSTQLDKSRDFTDVHAPRLLPAYSVICTYANGNAMQQIVKTLDIEKYIREMIDADSKADNQLLSAVALRTDPEVIDSVAAVRNYTESAIWYFTTKCHIKGVSLKQSIFPPRIKKAVPNKVRPFVI